MIPVEVETSLATISGYVGIPDSARKKGAHQFFFANGRYMRHPYFAKAIMSAYERLIPEGEQVHYFLNFNLDPSRIDVNIHPQKTEIKFQDDQALWQIILAAVREALGKFNAIPTIDFDTTNSPNIPIFNPNTDTVVQPQVHINNQFNPFATNNENKTSSAHSSTDNRSPSTTSNHRKNNDWQELYTTIPEEDFKISDDSTLSNVPTLYDKLSEEEQIIWEKNDTPCFQFRGRFIVTATNKGLLLVDQHRAHMRLLYDMYRQQQNEHQGVSQGLLFPQMLQLSPSSATTFDTLLPTLADVGFDISPLGGGSYAIQGIPTGTEGVDYITLLQGIADDALQGKLQAGDPVIHLISLSLSQKAALPIGQYLTPEEMADLIERLFTSSDATYAPDGHKIQILISTDNLQNYFN